MSTSNPEQEQGQRRGLADEIYRRRGDIERRWLEEVRRSFPVSHLDHTELRNGMLAYLTRLADGLRASDTAGAGGTASWKNVASEHAETRVRLGFNIDQLVQEFIILRRVLVKVIDDDEHGSLDIVQIGKLVDLIEGAIAAAVASYVESRDYRMRKCEAEHVGFITHELRNPLTTSTLGLVYLRRSLSLTPAQDRSFGIVERNLQRLAELIDGVLLLESHAYAPAPKLARRTLRDVLEEIVTSARLVAEAKGLNFEARFDPEVIVLVDPRLTRSAIESVVQNALKYTDDGRIEIVAEDTPVEVVVHVCDSGPGISADECSTIFEPFRRGRSKKSGAGLGLAVARRSVEAQGGKIRVERGELRGCRFSLTLPKPRR